MLNKILGLFGKKIVTVEKVKEEKQYKYLGEELVEIYSLYDIDIVRVAIYQGVETGRIVRKRMDEKEVFENRYEIIK